MSYADHYRHLCARGAYWRRVGDIAAARRLNNRAARVAFQAAAFGETI